MNYASQGDRALTRSDSPSAILYFTRALAEHPRSPAYYVKRSTANARLKPADGGPNSKGALRDAEVALHLAWERGTRELVLSAQLRRGVALFQLERYGDADYLFGLVKGKLDGGSAGKGKSEELMAAVGSAGLRGSRESEEVAVWLMKVQMRLKRLGEGDDKANVTVAEYPSGVHVPSEKELTGQLEALKSGKKAAGGNGSASLPQTLPPQGGKHNPAPITTTSAAAPALSPASVGKIRHEWYQSNDNVVLALYAKGVDKASIDADLKNDRVCVCNSSAEAILCLPLN